MSRQASPKGTTSQGWYPFLLFGVIAQVVGGIVMGFGFSHTNDAGENSPLAGPLIIGGLIAWVGVMLLTVGIIALGVLVGLRQHADERSSAGA